MPAPRKTGQWLDTIDDHGSALIRAGMVIRSAVMDGVIEPAELVAIEDTIAGLSASHAAISRTGQLADGAMSLIGMLANTADPTTPYVQRSYRELVADFTRLDGIPPVDRTEELTNAAD